MIDPNGTLELHAVSGDGYIWSTACRKCGTVQRIKLGYLSLEEATAAVEQIDRIPRECPGGYHVELTGWKRLWSLDLMLTQLKIALAPQPAPKPEPVGRITPTAVHASEGWAA